MIKPDWTTISIILHKLLVDCFKHQTALP